MRRTIEVAVSEPEEARALYEEATSLAQDGPELYPAAYELLLRAHAAGSSEAAYALGNWHGHGIHVGRDVGKAHALFEEAAKGDVPEALFNLGVTYEKGMLGRRDEFLAYRCYLRAALFGDLDATYEVFRCLRDGVGTPRDLQAAAIWKDAFVARGGDFEAVDSERTA